MRRARPGLASVVLLAALGGCGRDGEAGPKPPTNSTTAVPTTIGTIRPILSPTEPQVRIEPGTAGPPEVLELRINPIVNPTLSGFILRVVLEVTGGGRYELGQLSAFPPDNPGTFALRLPEDAVRELNRGDRKATVALQLEPVADDVPLGEALRLVVASATLRGG